MQGRTLVADGPDVVRSHAPDGAERRGDAGGDQGELRRVAMEQDALRADDPDVGRAARPDAREVRARSGGDGRPLGSVVAVAPPALPDVALEAAPPIAPAPDPLGEAPDEPQATGAATASVAVKIA